MITPPFKSGAFDFTKIEQMKTDPLVTYITDMLDEARFETQPDGTMWCSDSNASIDPHQVAKDIRFMLKVEI